MSGIPRLAVAAAMCAGAAMASKGDLVRGILRGNKVPADVCGGVTSESGYFNINATYNKNYFYWSFPSLSNPSTDPTVIWLTGGPGCSSILALLTENGPCTVGSDGKAVANPYGWNQRANVIWVDQPAGAGFSYSDMAGYDTDEAGVSADMYRFIQAYFQAHPQLLQNDLFIFGESYGGHYVPAVSYAVFQGNQNLAPGDVYIPLKGIAIGNGLTDPLVQYQYYAELAYNYSIAKLGHPSVSLSAYKQMVKAWPQCQSMIAACQSDTSQCANAQSFCNDAMLGPYENTGLNPYDIRLQCEYQPLCYDMTGVTNFLNDPKIQAALGVNIQWQPCNFVVNAGFGSDWMKRFQQLIPPQMANGTRFMQYSGDVDFVCNWLGNQAWTLALDWAGKANFNAAPVTVWNVSGSPAGEYRHYDTMTFLRVYNAGHMVPSDQPAAALALLNQFLAGGLSQ